VTVAATESVSLSGQNSGLFSSTFGSGNAGMIFISTPNLALADGAQIGASTAGAGQGGNVTVAATESVSLSGQNSGLFSSTFGNGNGGKITIETGRLMAMKDAGIFVDTFGAGTAGDVKIKTGELTLMDGAEISTTTNGSGSGGNLEVIAKDVAIRGIGSTGVFSGLFINAQSPNTQANAGNLTLTTEALRVADGGVISGITLGEGKGGNFLIKTGTLNLTGGGLISTSTSGPGDAGSILVQATGPVFIGGRLDTQLFRDHAPRISDKSGIVNNAVSIVGPTKLGDAGSISLSTPASLVLADGGEISTNSTGDGMGGKISLQARQVELSNSATISAKSSGSGNAGDILITAGDTFRSASSAVTTEADRAGGGSIALSAGRLVHLIDSEMTTTVQGGGGDAGNITIDPRFIILEGSRIIANAFQGMGGNIRLDAGVFLADPASLVSASSTLGIQGTVDIRAPVTSLSGTLAPLPQAFVSAAELLPARCAARLSGGKVSSLVLGGREALPPDPGGLLPSPLALDARLLAGPAVPGVPRQLQPSRFALLAVDGKVLPRVHMGHLPGASPRALTWRCAQ